MIEDFVQQVLDRNNIREFTDRNFEDLIAFLNYGMQQSLRILKTPDLTITDEGIKGLKEDIKVRKNLRKAVREYIEHFYEEEPI